MAFKHWEDLASPDCPVTFTGPQVTQIRELMGWTQDELGVRLGLTRQAVANWERVGVDVVRACALRFAVIYHDCLRGKPCAQTASTPS